MEIKMAKGISRKNKGSTKRRNRRSNKEWI